MKPSPDKFRQIADIHAVRSQSGERVPMGMKGSELFTETFRCSLKMDFHKLVNSIDEPPIPISYRSTTGGGPDSQDTDLHYITFIPDPSDKSISQEMTSYEGGMVYGDETSEPPGVTVRLLTTANPCPPGCISYSLSETLWGDHMQRVQEMKSTLTISVSDGMLGMWNGKHSLSDYHLYPLDYITSYSLINHLTDFRQEKDSG